MPVLRKVVKNGFIVPYFAKVTCCYSMLRIPRIIRFKVENFLGLAKQFVRTVPL